MAIETNSVSLSHTPDSTHLAPTEWSAHLNLEWDAFVDAHPWGHPLQLTAWRNLKCRFGWEASRVIVRRSPEDVMGGAQILYRRVLGLTLAYVPRGPVVDWQSPQAVAQVLAQLEETAALRGASVIKLEPPVLDSFAARELLQSLGYSPSLQTVQPPSTVRVDLTGDETAILAQMKSKWRYNVRLAARKGVEVRAATVDDLPAFQQLMAITGARDGFAVHDAAYYQTAYEQLCPQRGIFLLAEFAGRPLASIVVAHCGDTALYLWGASNNEERNRMPNHALQWAGMQWAKARGAAWYDLWGVPDDIGRLALGLNREGIARAPVDALPLELEQLPGHDLWGVYRFKQGFGGEAVRYVGAWDKTLAPAGGRIYQLGLAGRAVLGQAKTLAREGRTQLQNLQRQLGPAQGEDSADVADPSRPDTRPGNWQSIHNPQAWQSTLAQFSAPHVLQSWEWGAVKAQTGWQARRMVLGGVEPGSPVAAMQLLTRRLVPGLPWSIGYVPKGPVVDWDTLENPYALLREIERAARRAGCIFVKIDPDVRTDSPVGRLLSRALTRRGWQYSPNQIQFQNTAYSLLAGSAGAAAEQSPTESTEDAVLGQMKSKWRYNIRLAERRGIQVRTGSEADLPLFYGLYAETGRRDGFLVRPYGYYLETWRAYLQAQQEPGNPAGGALLLAHHPDDREPVAGLFLLRYGPRAWYFYGASSERRRRDMPNHLLQWAALRWSIAQGCTVYDWWGAPDDPQDPENSMQGVWQFKQGFGAEFQPHIGAWDFPVIPRAYSLFTNALPRVIALLRRL